MTKSKKFTEDATRRLYRTENGAAVSCAIQHQRAYDPDDGQQAGFYGWCGLLDDQSDYMLGPYTSAEAVFRAYARRNRKHARMQSITLYQRQAPLFTAPDGTCSGGDTLPSRKGKKCMLCLKPIDIDAPVFHCSTCLEN